MLVLLYNFVLPNRWVLFLQILRLILQEFLEQKAALCEILGSVENLFG